VHALISPIFFYGEQEENDFEEGREKGYKDKRGETRAKSQQGGAEQRSVRGNIEQGDKEHEVNREEGRKSNMEGERLLRGESGNCIFTARFMLQSLEKPASLLILITTTLCIL
jgi:hypothetical protein